MTNEQLQQQQDHHVELIDLEEFTEKGQAPPPGKHYRVKIGGLYYVFHEQWVSREQILEKAGYQHFNCHLLYQLIRGSKLELVEPGHRVDLARPGIEHFLVADPELWHYTIDGEKETTEHPEFTPNQILEMAEIQPVTNYFLVRVFEDGQQKSFKGEMDKPIKMVCPAANYISVYDGPTPVS